MVDLVLELFGTMEYMNLIVSMFQSRKIDSNNKNRGKEDDDVTIHSTRFKGVLQIHRPPTGHRQQTTDPPTGPAPTH